MKMDHIVSTKILGDEFLHRLKANGLRVTQHDFIKKRINIPANISDVALHSTIVLTSQTAVEAWMMMVRKFKLNLDQYPVYCLAHATRRAATQHGLKILGVADNALLLAQEISKNPSIKAVTFVCGNLHRDEITNLKEQGIDVQEMVVYQTEFTPHKMAEYQAVLFFSPSAVNSFLSMNEIKANAIVFCIGNATAHRATAAGYKNIQLAKTPTQESVVDAVLSYLTNQTVHAQK